MKKMTVRDIDLTGKRVLVRVDFNVPFSAESGQITDDSRIRAALSTIEYLKKKGARIILASHMGRPDGQTVPSLSLRKVADRLEQILKQNILFADDCIGQQTLKSAMSLEEGGVLLLENLRFHPQEEADNHDPFAKQLAALAEIYVDDAFGTVHRAHASIVGVAKFLPAVSGLLLEKEIDALTHVLENPPKPFTVLLGGAKVSDKVGLLKNVMDKVDNILIGGGMAATFLCAKGLNVGCSRTEDIEAAKFILDSAAEKSVKIYLPDDVRVAARVDHESGVRNVKTDEIPTDMMIVDIGTLTISNFRHVLERSRTVFWNGPMGIYEIPQFAEGTVTMAKLIAEIHGTTIIGGGSTAENVLAMGLAEKMSFVSTGGGASLKFLSGKALPGVAALMDKKEASHE
ncbi:MAG: phosphoglycerate kinase [Chloroflexi bacterium]|nr:phosphoglycerate kinase [Chloroflexota bacterium]